MALCPRVALNPHWPSREPAIRRAARGRSVCDSVRHPIIELSLQTNDSGCGILRCGEGVEGGSPVVIVNEVALGVGPLGPGPDGLVVRAPDADSAGELAGVGVPGDGLQEAVVVLADGAAVVGGGEVDEAALAQRVEVGDGLAVSSIDKFPSGGGTSSRFNKLRKAGSPPVPPLEKDKYTAAMLARETQAGADDGGGQRRRSQTVDGVVALDGLRATRASASGSQEALDVFFPTPSPQSMVTLPIYALQSICTLALVQARAKTPEPGAVSSQKPTGVP